MTTTHIVLLVSQSVNFVNWVDDLFVSSSQHIQILTSDTWDNVADILQAFNVDACICEASSAPVSADVPCIVLRAESEPDIPCTISMILPVRFVDLASRVFFLCSETWGNALKRHPQASVIPSVMDGLTDKEIKLLQCIQRGAGKPVSKRDLALRVWHHRNETEFDSHTFDTHLYTLRRKLTASGNLRIIGTSDGYSIEKTVPDLS